jgi:hypothetical protein
MANPLKPWSNPPQDAHTEWINWVTSALNQVIGQAAKPPSSGLQSVQNNTVNPTSAQISSLGNRTNSIVTKLSWTASVAAGVATITLFWDGTNGSQVFQIGRDDGTIYGPNAQIAPGSPYVITGLNPSTRYFFYPYFDETLQRIQFPSIIGSVAGSPAIAYTVGNFKAAQQQLLSGHIRIAPDLADPAIGISTPAAGSTSGTTQTGGGSGGGAVDYGTLITQ